MKPVILALLALTAYGQLSVTLGTKGLASVTVGGTPMVLQANAPPVMVQAAMIDPFNVRSIAATLPVSTTASGQTVVQVYPWGVVSTSYVVAGMKLSVAVSVTNTSAAKSIDHLWFYPIALNFPSAPVNMSPSAVTCFNSDAPCSIFWNYGSGTVDLVNDDVRRPLGLGWWKVSSASTTKWYVSLFTDSQKTISRNFPPVPRPIAPGATDTFTISLRFGNSVATEKTLAGDLLAAYALVFPRTVQMPVNKPIAALNMTSARFVAGKRTPWPTNPRGWFNDPTVDVTTPGGLVAFQARLLAYGDSSITEMRRVGAMGCLLWDLEGQQFDAAYIGDPMQIEAIAPELIGVLDKFVAKFIAAGFRVGFTVRPQVFDLATATQTNTPEPGKVMYVKMQYAAKRWGASMFYIDSDLDLSGAVNPASSFLAITNAMPGVLLFPEWENTKHYAYTAPYNNASNHLFGAPASATMVYPGAVGLVKVNDAAAALYPAQIKAAVAAGNILLWDAWYRHSAGDLVKAIYGN